MTLGDRMSCVHKKKAGGRDIPDTEELSGSGTKGDVGTGEVVNRSLREHGVVLKLRLAEGRAVGGNEDKFS